MKTTFRTNEFHWFIGLLTFTACYHNATVQFCVCSCGVILQSQVWITHWTWTELSRTLLESTNQYSYLACCAKIKLLLKIGCITNCSSRILAFSSLWPETWMEHQVCVIFERTFNINIMDCCWRNVKNNIVSHLKGCSGHS